jgi:hypothetical protein
MPSQQVDLDEERGTPKKDDAPASRRGRLNQHPAIRLVQANTELPESTSKGVRETLFIRPRRCI